VAAIFIKSCTTGTGHNPYQKLKVELFYKDTEVTTPIIVLEKKKPNEQHHPLLEISATPETPEQNMCSTSYTTVLRFRIQEVTLKVRVSAIPEYEKLPAQRVVQPIHPAISERAIHVLSKPKYTARKPNTEQYRVTEWANVTELVNDVCKREICSSV
jgi:hypothetical protein